MLFLCLMNLLLKKKEATFFCFFFHILYFDLYLLNDALNQIVTEILKTKKKYKHCRKKKPLFFISAIKIVGSTCVTEKKI